MKLSINGSRVSSREVRTSSREEGGKVDRSASHKRGRCVEFVGVVSECRAEARSFLYGRVFEDLGVCDQVPKEE